MMNPRPLGLRKTIQLLIALTLLAWATQTLFHQWGYGAVIVPQATSPSAKADGLVIEVRPRIQSPGATVMLRDVCKWSDRDQAVLEPVAEVVIKQLGQTPGVETVSIGDIRAALKASGVNPSSVTFTGAATCAITSGKVTETEIQTAIAQPGEAADEKIVEETQTVEQPVVAKPQATVEPSTQAAEQSTPADEIDAPAIAEMPQTPLKNLLIAELMEHLKLPADQIAVEFSPRDEPTLSLTSPTCRFEIEDRTATSLGPVMWTVRIKTEFSETTSIIQGICKVWEDQLITTRKLSKGQAFIASDLSTQRVLVQFPGQRGVGKPDQVVGQIATRNLQAGETVSTLDVEGKRIIEKGEFVTVSMTLSDQTTIETVAKALDGGAAGNLVRAKNEATGEVYRVRVTGPGTGQVVPIDAQDVASVENR